MQQNLFDNKNDIKNNEIYENENLGRDYYIDEDEDENQSYEMPNNKERTYKSKLVNSQISYPEIYKILEPMIAKTLQIYQEQQFNEDILNQMTNQIYDAIEVDNNQITEDNTNSQEVSINLKDADKEDSVAQKLASTTYQEGIISSKKNFRENSLLRDLIKILLIQKIINS